MGENARLEMEEDERELRWRREVLKEDSEKEGLKGGEEGFTGAVEGGEGGREEKALLMEDA